MLPRYNFRDPKDKPAAVQNDALRGVALACLALANQIRTRNMTRNGPPVYTAVLVRRTVQSHIY